jgi:hypothetical protein
MSAIARSFKNPLQPSLPLELGSEFFSLKEIF